MSLAREWSAAFEALIRLTQAHATRDGVSDPTLEAGPCWHACRRLAEAGTPPDPEEPVARAAFWEWLAWAAEELYGGDAEDFAIECRAMADSVILAAA